MSRISIALCTYNGARHLPDQLKSYLEQTRLPFELVVCDDGSTDDTIAVLEAFAETAPFQVRIIRNPKNLGYAKNFEKAIGLCEGDFIALSDQDDYWLPQKLEWCAEILEQNPGVSLVFTDAQVVDNNLQPLGYTIWEALDFTPAERAVFADDPFDFQLKRNHATGATIFLRSAHREQVFPFPDHWIHDDWMTTVLAAYTGIVPLDRPTMLYRQHGNNQVGIQPGRYHDDVFELDQSLVARVKRTQELRDWLPRRMRAHLCVMIVQHLNQKKHETNISDAMLEKVTNYTRHVRARTYLPPNRLLRLPSILEELVTGRYKRFSPGGKLPFGISIALADVLRSNKMLPPEESPWAKVNRTAKNGQGIEVYNSPPPKV